MPDEPAIRIMLCDDHELVRRGLSSILDGVGGITVVAEAGDADAALKAVEASHPDVVIMDCLLYTSNWAEQRIGDQTGDQFHAAQHLLHDRPLHRVTDVT